MSGKAKTTKKKSAKNMKMTSTNSPLPNTGPSTLPHMKDALLQQQQQQQTQQQQTLMTNNNNNMIHSTSQMMAKQQQQQQQSQQHPNHQQHHHHNNNHQQQHQHMPTTSTGINGQGQQPQQPVNVYTTAGYNQTLSPNNNNVKQCTGCGLKIIDRFLLHAMDKYWHTGCLKCSCCQAPLGDIGGSCFTRNGMILCKNDYLRLFGNTGKCSGCGQVIPAQEFVMKAQSHVYHVNCFSCVVCHCKLIRGDRYSIYQGNLLCEHDFPKVVRGNIQVPPPMKVNKIC